MLKLISFGCLSALFFSSTFILNRAMSLEGGHWLWTASLRYAWMLLLLVGGLLLLGRISTLRQLCSLFRQHWCFWILTGSTGFGLFYAMLSFSASYAPGWVIATSWQMTILATPLVLLLFGRPIPIKALLFLVIIFAGILLVNLAQLESSDWMTLLLGGLPVLVAAFAYPLGNQLLWEAQRGGNRWLPDVNHPLLADAFNRILLLTIGTIPFWLLLLVWQAPPPPSPGQLLNTGLVAVLSGVIATSLFLQARHRAKNAYQISAIDATQSGEMIFSLLGEVVFLQGLLPGTNGWLGIALTVVGLILYLTSQSKPDRTPPTTAKREA